MGLWHRDGKRVHLHDLVDDHKFAAKFRKKLMQAEAALDDK